MKSISGKILFAGLFLAVLFFSCMSDENLSAPEPGSPLLFSYEMHQLTVYPGDVVTLKGINFGKSRGQSSVVFQERTVNEYISWSDTLIQLEVPDTVSDGYICINVNVNGKIFSSNTLSYIVKKLYSYISGFVKLSDGTPLEGVMVSAGTDSSFTDIYGQYILSCVVGKEVTVRPNKAFYSFSAPQNVKPVSGGINNVNFTALRTDGMIIQTIRENDLTIYSINSYSTVIVKVPYISDYLYQTSNPRTLEQLASSGNYRVVVNSSYFDYDLKTQTYLHAGYLKINDQVLSQTKPDKQIMQLFAYKINKKILTGLKFFELSELDNTKDYDLVFQTGPHIVKNNTVASSSIDSSINGNNAMIRTAFASAGKDYYVIITRSNVDLKYLGNLLINSGIFYGGELNVINFDGGPSTALYIKGHPEFSFNSKAALPLTIGIK